MRSFAGEYGLEVTSVDQGRRAVSLRGTGRAVAEAFGAQWSDGLGKLLSWLPIAASVAATSWVRHRAS
ncbi:MAG: hypothetical protein ACLP0L_01765 [Solirubrobacteraceae bacterium]